jgi:CcmD family protein
MSGGTVWVMGACVVVWLGLFGYLVYVERRVRDLEKRL